MDITVCIGFTISEMFRRRVRMNLDITCNVVGEGIQSRNCTWDKDSAIYPNPRRIPKFLAGNSRGSADDAFWSDF